MPGDEVYELYIDALTPAAISMARLAEYMTDFAEILGHQEHIHFEGVKPGSLSLTCRVEPVAQNKVRRRIEELRYRTAPKSAMKAYSSLDRRLAEDNAVGRILQRTSKVIEFPGRTRVVEQSTGPIEQPGSLDGEVIQIGGRDETINVHLKVGDEIVHCVTSKPVARRLAPHLFGQPIRLSGKGVWSRAESGAWSVRRFTITDFETLDWTPLPKLFAGLRTKLGPAPEHRPNPVAMKFDRQIIAIALTNGARILYSDDEGVKKFGERSGLRVVRTSELPPPSIQQDLFEAKPPEQDA